jgi:protein-tyrosine-phosphatase
VSAERPGAVLFACAMNAVRSPMAEALLKYVAGKAIYVNSAGARKGERDDFVTEVMEEIGLDVSKHRPRTFEELEDLEGLNFDLIISLSPEAHHRALELTRTRAVDVEYWPTIDPTTEQGSREQRLEAYRQVRDQLLARIRKRFPPPPKGAP